METVLGLPRNSVRLVPYEPRWAELFAREADVLRQCLGARIVTIEHIGSTAVPGLAAKPVLDLMVSVPSLQLPESFFSDILMIGYQHRRLDTIHGRLFFAKGSADARTHNLSVCEAGSPFWLARIVFRDRLRSDLKLAEAYAALKYQLAERFPANRLAYTDAKESFILAAIDSSSL